MVVLKELVGQHWVLIKSIKDNTDHVPKFSLQIEIQFFSKFAYAQKLLGYCRTALLGLSEPHASRNLALVREASDLGTF